MSRIPEYYVSAFHIVQWKQTSVGKSLTGKGCFCSVHLYERRYTMQGQYIALHQIIQELLILCPLPMFVND